MVEVVSAVETVRRMRGGSQPCLVRCSDGEYYVIKSQNNPQGVRILANELLGTLLARRLGLPVPEFAVVEINEALIQHSDEMVIELAHGRIPYSPGLCFGSRYPKSKNSITDSGLATVYDIIPLNLFHTIDNRADFLGMVVFDKWVGNMDHRQVIFVRDEQDANSRPYRSHHALMIDQGFCFNGSEWSFLDSPKHGLYGRAIAYEKVSGLSVFETWLNRLECGIDRNMLEEATQEIPKEWNDGAGDSLAQLVARLDQRRFQVRSLLCTTRKAIGRLFSLSSVLPWFALDEC